MIRPLVVALASGAATVLGFAPFEVFPLPVLTLVLLFRLWRRAPSPGQAALLAFAWGLGCFVAGVSWVYVSLHVVGGMAAPLAALATLAFCAFLALFPALAGYLGCRWRTGRPWRDALLVAGSWTLVEWLRSWLLTGFPWLAIGYSQTPPSPLAGFAPLFGVFGVGFLVVLIAALLAAGWRDARRLAAIAAIAVAGIGLHAVAWTQPAGEPFTAALLQGNIPQSLKWVPENLSLSVQTYARLASEHPAQLTVLPETAIPLMFDQIPREVLETLTRHGDALIGTAVRTRQGGYTNGAVALTPELAVQAYTKVHLVPFGEYIPPGFDWFFSLVDIPMDDFTAGPAGQKPLSILGQKVMPNICYEDAFGELIRAGLPEATVLVNLSNTAWFGDSLAQPQHLQIARMRAMETGRPILRATNTGMTAALAPDGSVGGVLPPFTTGALTVGIRGYVGRTPFSQVGDRLAAFVALLACLPAWRLRRRMPA